MSTLSDFQDLVNDIDDEQMLGVAEELLREMLDIENMKEKIKDLEAGLSKGTKASFWFFAMGLDKEQVDLAANTVIGRKRFILDKQAKVKRDFERNNPPPQEESVKTETA